jgi:DNA-binding NarL/FixJ family response regulator
MTIGWWLNLTPREFDVVESLVQYGTAKGIASELGISRLTVRQHLASAKTKAGVRNMTLLAVQFVRMERERWPAETPNSK